MSSKQLVIFGGGLNGGILSRSLCYTSCVPEGKHKCIYEPLLIALRGSTKGEASTLSNKKKKRKKHSIRLPSLNLVYTLRDSLGSPMGRFTTKAVEKTGISLSPRLENSSLLALAALNFALSAISRNRHVKRAAASALGAQYCALYFLPPEELRAVSRRRRGRAKERRGEERRGEKRSGASEIKRQRKDREEEEKKERKREGQTEGASFEKSLMESLGSGMAKCLAKQRGFVNKRVSVIKCYIHDKLDKG
ncbi:hypothetical protein G5I_03903 [Acromyrmex echinatior]|uniref:Uncharacterized protein n=1 Tax=Acromyrmex echinatior TaxID=103372 RepID=F4WE72_ACREC|nr:hypothetical protein G5I_03903 [Acromyrmex echinatior]